MGKYKDMWDEYTKQGYGKQVPRKDYALNPEDQQEGWDANGSPIPACSSYWYPDTYADKEDICNHQWKYYMGLNEAFEYCTRCDKKRDPQDKEKEKKK